MRPARKQKSLFSRRLIRLRQERGLTQQELADEMGTSLSSISYLEAKATNPRSTTLTKLADFFNVPVGYFFGEGD